MGLGSSTIRFHEAAADTPSARPIPRPENRRAKFDGDGMRVDVVSNVENQKWVLNWDLSQSISSSNPPSSTTLLLPATRKLSILRSLHLGRSRDLVPDFNHPLPLISETVSPRHEPDECTFPASKVTDESNDFAGFGSEVEVLEEEIHRRIRWRRGVVDGSPLNTEVWWVEIGEVKKRLWLILIFSRLQKCPINSRHQKTQQKRQLTESKIKN